MTWEMLVTRGWLWGWLAIVPVAAMVTVWLIAVFCDRMEAENETQTPV